jgi:hypothetical protein
VPPRQLNRWALIVSMKKLCLIAILILFPAVGLSQDASPAEKFRTNEKYRNTLSVFREPQIVSAINARAEVYRIFIIPTFYHPLSIRIEQSGKRYVLIAKRLGGQGGYGWGTLKHERRRRLTVREWQTFLNLLRDASYWTLPTEDAEFQPNEKGEVTLCLDSTSWILEGVSDGKYHVVDRYCPARKGVKEVGLYMVRLTKWATKESDFR